MVALEERLRSGELVVIHKNGRTIELQQFSILDQELLNSRDQAWREFSDFEAEEWYPRSYRRKSGNSKKHINAFADTDEIKLLATQKQDLYGKWLKLHFECVAKGLPGMGDELWNRWTIELTPDGERYRRSG